MECRRQSKNLSIKISKVRKGIGRLLEFCFLLLLSWTASAAQDKILLRIDGGYLAYSFDHGQIFGENVTFFLADYKVTGQYLKVDLASRAFLVFGAVALNKDAERLEADEFLFDPEKANATLVRYGETVELLSFPQLNAPGEALAEVRAKLESLNELTLAKIQKSLIYATAKTMEISPAYETYGLDVTFYVEGVESIGFKKIKLSMGDSQRANGFSLDKLWFTRTQGLFGKISYSYELENKIRSLTQAYYEEHSILKDYAGLARQLDLQTSTTWSFNKQLALGIAGNYNSSSLWNARVFLDKKGKDDKSRVLLDFAFNKPLETRGEAWVGLQSSWTSETWGEVAFSGKYELHNQTLASFSFRKTFLKKIQMFLGSSFSHILTGAGGSAAKIFTGDVSLSYNADLFNLSTDYYLNYDLFGNQRLTRPQLRFGLNPLTFYGGILTASVMNISIWNTVKIEKNETQSYSNNTSLNISAKPLWIQKDTYVQVNLAVEQFLEKEGRNFTSGGAVVRAAKTFAPGVSLEGFYSLQSRRKSKSWLIEGTTSQDLSAVFRAGLTDRLNGWMSLSYDPKAGEWKQSFANITIGLIKNWRFQSLLNYDFRLRKVNNIDLYLIRKAGRFELRFIWRSISKQILVELIPAL